MGSFFLREAARLACSSVFGVYVLIMFFAGCHAVKHLLITSS